MSSAASPREPIPALEALGREFDRAVRDAPRRRSPLVAPGRQVIIPVLIAVIVAFMALTPVGRALAHHVGELVGITDERAAIEAICADSSYCRIVDGTETATGSSRTTLVKPGEALVTEGRTISSCPDAAAAYAAAGIHVAAFVGPCPAADEFPKPNLGGGDASLDQARDDLRGN